MKIAYFLDFPHCVGGSNKVLLTQAYIMNKKGHKAIVVIPDDENGHALEYDTICKGYELNTITAKFLITTCMESIDILSAFQHYNDILELLKREKVDLIHSTQINITVEMVARELNIPHLMNIYQTDLESFNIKWMDIYPHYHSADSELFSKRWERGLCILSRCIRVAYKIKDIERVDRIYNMPLNLLCVGVFAEHKNQLEVIKLVLFCRENGIDVLLTLLGNDETTYGQECKDFVKYNNLEEKVIFQGFVSNVEDYFEHADLMILASKVESFPGVIVESIANRVPVLSTPVAGVPELLQDEYNAFLTKGYHMQDLYEAFKRYLKYRNRGNIQDIIDRAYETYIHNHSYEIVGTQIENYYEWILKDYNNSYSQIKIDYVKEVFGKFIKNKCLEKEKLYTKSNIWFLYHLSKKINSKKINKIAIWGAGLLGKEALKWINILNCKEYFVGFIDTYKEGVYLGYPIIKAREQVILSCDVILLAIGNSKYCLEIMKSLDDFGKKRNKDYFLMLNGPIRI